MTLAATQVFEEIKGRVSGRADLVKKVNAVFAWNITQGGKTAGTWVVDMKNKGEVHQGEVASLKPDVTITVSDEDFVQLAQGKLNAQKAFMSGKIKVKGNVMLAQKIEGIFKAEGGTAAAAAAIAAPAAPAPSAASSSSLKSDAFFEGLTARLSADPSIVKKVNAVFEWNVTQNGKTASQWTVDLKNGAGSVKKGPASPKADCSLTVSDEDLMNLVAGKANAQKLFMGGKLKIQGNVMLAQKLGALFATQSKL